MQEGSNSINIVYAVAVGFSFGKGGTDGAPVYLLAAAGAVAVDGAEATAGTYFRYLRWVYVWAGTGLG